MTVFRQPSLLFAGVTQAIFAKRDEGSRKSGLFDQNANWLDSYRICLCLGDFGRKQDSTQF
jgi:hypothetical protein